MKVVQALMCAMAVFASVEASECRIASRVQSNCCWGGDGAASCIRQRQGGIGDCNGVEEQNYCSNNGVTKAQCNADCCSTDMAANGQKGFGIGCPK
ncbi:hypothetical protein NM208_g7176 [Fusarium decemcellulare]|uniref:Uncharacterized protein n=1 Tax=Fusarium decemcellulare TaxID=57161 RepID=A0ACC1SA81_9HYPO|nr:hypothetical protein NM208_g7176 [Fusarium decemcellulare]